MGVLSLSPCPARPAPAVCTVWLFLFLLALLCYPRQVSGQAVQNVTFQNTASALTFSPPVCNVGVVDAGIPDSCLGTWTIVDLQGSSNGSVTSTEGPADAFHDLLPQVFFTFQGSALFVKTSDASNATGNLTISSQPSGRVQNIVFSPSLDFWAVRNLDDTQTTTAALTFIPDDFGVLTHLDIDFVKISVSDASASSSFLATPPASQPTFTPTFAFPSTVSPTSTSPPSRLRQPVGTIIGEVFAALFGILILGLCALFAWQWRKRRKHDSQRRARIMRVQAASQILAGGDGSARSRPTEGDLALPVQTIFPAEVGPQSRSGSYSSGQPRVIPFPSESVGRSTRRSDPLPHRVRARERASSAFTMLTGGGASSALAEDGHSGVGAAHSRGASASF